MKALAELAVSALDLLEAEGRSLKHNVVRLVAALGLLAVTTAVTLVGVLLLLRGVYLYLEYFAGPQAAALIAGLVTLSLAGVLAWIATRLVH